MLLEGTRLGRVGGAGGARFWGPCPLCPSRSQEPGPARRNLWELRQQLWREQPAPHLLSQAICCPALWAWPLLGAPADVFLPLGETNPQILLLQARASLPGQFPCGGTAQQGSARQLESHWGPGHLSHGCPQDPASTLLCIGTNLWRDRCHRQG